MRRSYMEFVRNATLSRSGSRETRFVVDLRSSSSRNYLVGSDTTRSGWCDACLRYSQRKSGKYAFFTMFFLYLLRQRPTEMMLTPGLLIVEPQDHPLQ